MATKSSMTLDPDSAAILYEGANMSQMERLFKMDARDLKERIHGLPPIGKRGNAQIWAIYEVVKHLYVPSEEQLVRVIPTMHHNSLPKQLHKEFWDALRSKQQYLLAAGDLWPTEKVVEVYARLVKLVKQRVQLRVDAVERQVDVDERVRKILRAQDDGFLRELVTMIEDEFKDRAPTDGEEEDDGEL